MANESDPDFYKKHPKKCAPDDFWGQVRRTINGKPVPDEQINMIVDSVIGNLKLNVDDSLLDICCGNGALTSYLYRDCKYSLGVDYSEPLIEIANNNFRRNELHEFLLMNAIDFVCNYDKPELFTKVLCYGSLQYFERPLVEKLLYTVREKFNNVERFLIGNLPDKQLADEFFGDDYNEELLADSGSAIGVWWNMDDFSGLANDCGWSVLIKKMPVDFYASKYRFDVVLEPK